MITVKLSVGPINFTNYILVIARKVSDPTVIAEQHSYGPATSDFNAVFTTLDPTNYYFDFRDSVDGVDLGILINTYTVDAQTNQIISETRYYTCGGSNTGDPANGATTIVDPYFIDKAPSKIFKEGFRFLIPITEWTYDNTTGTIAVINGTSFSTGETMPVEIDYKDALPVSPSGAFTSVKTITMNTTIDNTYSGARTKLTGASVVLVVSFPSLATFSDGAQFYFQSFGGAQNQTRFLMNGSDKISWDGFVGPYVNITELPEFWIGKGEFVWFEVRTTGGTKYLEVIQAHDGVAKVGEKVTVGFNSHPNMTMEDVSLVDGDEWPRLWWWLNNISPAPMAENNNDVIDDDATWKATYDQFTGVNYGKFGVFFKHDTLKKFRMPWTEGLSEKGLKDFTTYGTDSKRIFDYPGGFQDHAQLDHVHEQSIGVITPTVFGRGLIARLIGRYGGSQTSVTDLTSAMRNGDGSNFTAISSEVTVKNNGVIYGRRN